MPGLKELRENLSLADTAGRGQYLRLFLTSFAALYVEIMLIRWVGTEFRLFAYFQNLTLIACFLGFGYGCFRATKRPVQLFDYAALCVLAILIDLPWRGWAGILELMGAGLSLSPDVSIWHDVAGQVSWAGFTVSAMFVAGVLLLLIATMIPLGTWVGRFLEDAPNTITAYSINLFGSLAGIWFFAGVSFLGLAPVYWFALAFALALLMQPAWQKTGIAGVIAMAVCLTVLVFGRLPAGKTVWSPYQKLEVIPQANENYQINVNNTGYMTIANLSQEESAKNPELAIHYRLESSYETPYRFLDHLDMVLIVGSGAGNDVAAALRHQARSIDAVEIDPAIYNLGRILHPEKPYDSPSVHISIDDARDFMHRTSHRYDLILFGLLDSHTQYSSLSSMRIDNYVYTQEAFTEARRLLRPDGILIVKFELGPQFEWLGQRFYGELNKVFGQAPLVYYNPQVYGLLPATIFLTSKSDAISKKAKDRDVAAFLAEHPPRFPLSTASATPLTTDDWPYIYQRKRAIPRVYLAVSLILLTLSMLLVRKKFEYRRTSTWHFFLLGAGFLLLETQLVSRLALFFGSTWIVNCIALTFILLVLVAANFFVMNTEVKHLAVYYAVLVLCLIGIYLAPWARLPFSSRMVGVLLSTAYSVPLFFAGIIFTESFRRAKGRSECLGANILGAVAGGLAQNLSFIFGLKALLLIAAVSYGFAGVSSLFAESSSPPSPVTELGSTNLLNRMPQQ
jgi:spermidine synthase